MSQQYAEPLRPDIYACEEYTSLFSPRIHRRTSIADHASVQCHLDLYGEEGVGSKFGNLNAHAGNFVSLCAPNCLPERLALVAYTIEYAFLHDDDIDNGSDEHVLHENQMLHQALSQSGTTSITTRLTEATRRKSEVQAKIAAGYMRLDPVFGNWLVSCWEAFTKSTEDGRNLEFASLDDYLAFRLDDVAAVWTLSMLRWGTGIYLTPEEDRIADPISYVAYAALTLTNDLFSWEKEYKAHIESQGSVPLVNAVHTVMVSHGLDQEAAKAMIRNELRAHELRFCQMRDEYKAGPNPSSSVVDWFRLLEDTMAGNFIWSVRVPRYCPTDRDPYRDHLDAFDRDTIRVLTAPVEISSSIAVNGMNGTCQLSKREQLERPKANKASFTGNLPIKPLKQETVLNPYAYIVSLPSKNVRQTMILALNSWYKVPEESLLIIEGIVNFLHNSSLLLDDIQDGSSLRRGKPAAHRIFGIGQTINTATYLMNEALCLVQMLSQSALTAYSEEMRSLHIGQGHDLHWSYHTHVPSQEEYISMVDGKTGGLFRLICRLMQSEASINRDLDLTHFATLLGRYFQIRDDYQNLVSADYKQNKGFCEDLDEGKLSFPVILAMNTPGFPNAVMLSIFQSCHEERSRSPELKQYILDEISSRRVFPQTQAILKDIHSDVLRCLSDSESAAGGIENWTLRLLVAKLDIGNETKKEKEEKKPDSVWRLNQQKVWNGHQSERPTDQPPAKKRKRI